MAELDQLALALSAVGHPNRLRIMVLLLEGPMSPKQAAPEVDASLGTTAYHFRTMANAGLIGQCEVRHRRGAVEHFYELSTRGRKLAKDLGLGAP
jgi:DNA-binding transcriptional ArsR family regulator